MKQFPTQDECDPTKPEEHFLWALGQIPMGDKQMQSVQLNLARAISKHMHECGFRHYPKLQTKKLNKPYRGQGHVLNGSSRWVPMDAEPTAEPPSTPDINAMTVEEREGMIKELKDYGFISDPPPDRGKTAHVTSWKEIQSTKIKKAGDIT
jgi:hypothetical protein